MPHVMDVVTFFKYSERGYGWGGSWAELPPPRSHSTLAWKNVTTIDRTRTYSTPDYWETASAKRRKKKGVKRLHE